MRIISEFETQFKLGQSSLSEIKLDYTSRDDITKLLLGLQSISINKEAQTKIFQILRSPEDLIVMKLFKNYYLHL